MYHGQQHAGGLSHRESLWPSAQGERGIERGFEHAFVSICPHLAGCHRGIQQRRRRHWLLVAVWFEICGLLQPRHSVASSNHTLVSSALQRCCDAVHLCFGHALFVCGFEWCHRLRRYLWRIPFGFGAQPLHPECVAFEKPIRIHRQRPLHSLFPYRRGHAHQCAPALRGRQYSLGGSLHRLLRHFGQSHGRLCHLFGI